MDSLILSTTLAKQMPDKLQSKLGKKQVTNTLLQVVISLSKSHPSKKSVGQLSVDNPVLRPRDFFSGMCGK